MQWFEFLWEDGTITCACDYDEDEMRITEEEHGKLLSKRAL